MNDKKGDPENNMVSSSVSNYISRENAKNDKEAMLKNIMIEKFPEMLKDTISWIPQFPGHMIL